MVLLKNYKWQDHLEDPNPDGQPSMTLPNEALTMREMLIRYAKGIPLDGKTIRDPQYDPEATLDSTDLEKLKNADLFEKEEYMNSLGADLLEKAKKDKAAKLEQKKAEEEAKKAQEAEYELFKKWKSTQEPAPPKPEG